MSVNNERCERFDVADAIAAKVASEVDEFLDRSENVTSLDIENFVVVLSEVDEILSFSLLKFRFEATLSISFDDLT